MAEHVHGRMVESGVLPHWKATLTDVKRWRAVRGRPPDHTVLAMQHMHPLFYLLMLGHAIAVSVLLGELWWRGGHSRGGPLLGKALRVSTALPGRVT